MCRCIRVRGHVQEEGRSQFRGHSARIKGCLGLVSVLGGARNSP